MNDTNTGDMNRRLAYVIVGIISVVGGISTIDVPTSSAVDDDSCSNQMERQERFQDEFEDTENPNNDKGNLESWTNSFKNREPC